MITSSAQRAARSGRIRTEPVIMAGGARGGHAGAARGPCRWGLQVGGARAGGAGPLAGDVRAGTPCGP